MNRFAFGGAWSKGVGLFSGASAGHALILVGVGLVAPLLLQLALIGAPMMGLMNPVLLTAEGGSAAVGGFSGAVLMAALGGYVLQIGSYFGSWRLGLGKDRAVADSLVFGLLCGTMIVIGAGIMFALIALLASQMAAAGMVLLVIAFLLLCATLYTVMAALIGVAMLLFLLLVMVLGLSFGWPGASGFPGGAGLAAVVIALCLVLLVWLAARFSCTTAVMAAERRYNPFAAMAQSWRLTGENQFRVMLYLALIGLVLTILIFVATIVIGVGVVAAFEGGAAPELGVGALAIGLIVSIPFAYLFVLVPAGIYRELARSTVAAELFA